MFFTKFWAIWTILGAYFIRKLGSDCGRHRELDARTHPVTHISLLEGEENEGEKSERWKWGVKQSFGCLLQLRSSAQPFFPTFSAFQFKHLSIFLSLAQRKLNSLVAFVSLFESSNDNIRGCQRENAHQLHSFWDFFSILLRFLSKAFLLKVFTSKNDHLEYINDWPIILRGAYPKQKVTIPMFYLFF